MQGQVEQAEQQEFQQGVMKLYDLTVGKYDVTCEVGPSYTTKREESAEQMMNFVQSFPQAAPMIGDLIAKNLDWPGADDIADRLKAMLPTQAAGQNPQLQQMQQQMQQMDQQARQAVGQLTQQLEQAKQDKSIALRKLDIDAYGKETDRLKVTTPAFDPQQVQALVIQTLQQVLTSPDPSPQVSPPPMQQQSNAAGQPVQ
jgi:hypothetical protein